MKRTLSHGFFLLLAVLSILPQPAIAQEDIPTEEVGIGETQEISDPALKLTLKATSQEYPSKKFALTITINATFDSDKVGIDWKFPGNYFLLQGPSRDVVKVRQGETTTFVKYFLINPNLSAKNFETNKKVEFGARVNGFVAQVNYLSATKTVVDFNKEFEITPIFNEYQSSKTIQQILKWSAIIVGAIIFIVLLSVAVRRFRAYLNSDDKEA